MSTIKTDGLCISQPICVADPLRHHTPEWLWLERDVMKFTASLEYLPTQLSSRCAKATLPAKCVLASKASEGSAGDPTPLCVRLFFFFFAEFKHAFQPNHFVE